MLLVLYLGSGSCANVFKPTSTFSSMRFNITGFMLRSLIYLNLSFVHGDRLGSICILLYPVVPAPQLVEDAFFPLYNFGFFVKNQVFIGVWINVRVFDSISLIPCLFLCQYEAGFITIAL